MDFPPKIDLRPRKAEGPASEAEGRRSQDLAADRPSQTGPIIDVPGLNINFIGP